MSLKFIELWILGQGVSKLFDNLIKEVIQERRQRKLG